jgi:hypothetical protein
MPSQRSALSVLQLSLLGCAAVTLALGIFALAGDHLGLWKPLPAPGVQATAGKQVPAAQAASATTAPEPPVPADLALVVAGIAAGVALLASGRFRVLRLARSAFAHVSVGASGWMRRRQTTERLRPTLRSLVLSCRRRALALVRLLALAAVAVWIWSVQLALAFGRLFARVAVAVWIWSAQAALPAVWSRVSRVDARSIVEGQRAAFRSFARESGRIAASGGDTALALSRLIGNGWAGMTHFRYRRHVSGRRRQDIAWAVCAAVCALFVAFVVVSLGPR